MIRIVCEKWESQEDIDMSFFRRSKNYYASKLFQIIFLYVNNIRILACVYEP